MDSTILQIESQTRYKLKFLIKYPNTPGYVENHWSSRLFDGAYDNVVTGLARFGSIRRVVYQIKGRVCNSVQNGHLNLELSLN